MSGPITKKHLDRIEIQLTPKEWGIRLADEMRRHSSQEDILKALATKSYPESWNTKPFCALAEQAHERRPGNKPEDIHARNLLNRKLQTEYLGMKALILKVNEAVKEETESLRIKVALQLSALYILILRDAFGRSASKEAAWALEQKTADVYKEEESEFILNELAVYGDAISAETQDNGHRPGGDIGPGFASLIEKWAADSTLLIISFFTHKAAAQAIQEKYFEGHAILFEDVEARLDETIKALADASATFNEYLHIRDTNFQAELNKEDQEGTAAPVTAGELQDHLVMDIQAIRARADQHLVDPLANEWVEVAKHRAFTEDLEESGEHEAHVWESVPDQSQECEIPITVQGSRNTQAPQPFLEETYTVTVFPNGAVLRLLEVVLRGQIVIIQNMRLKQEIACRVVSFKPSRSVKGNVEVEFLQPAPGFWGIIFPGESPGTRNEASASTLLAPPVLPRRLAQPVVVAQTAAESRIEQDKASAPSMKGVMPPKREVKIVASPAAEVPQATPATNAKTRAVVAFPAPPVATSSIPPVPRPTPEDSLALNSAIIAAYTMPADAPIKAVAPDTGNGPTDSSASIRLPANEAPAAPASPIPPSVVTVPAANVESSSSSAGSNADTLDWKNAPSGLRNTERLPEPVRKSAPIANPSAVTDTIELIVPDKENVSKPTPALQTMDSERSSGGRLTSTSRTFAKRTKTFAVVGAAGVVIACGAGAYLWHLRGKAATSQPVAVAQIESTAAPSAPAPRLTQGPPAGPNAQRTPSATPVLNGPARRKQTSPTRNSTENAPTGKQAQNSADVAARQPSTLPSRIAAPVTPLTNAPNPRSENTISAPDLGAQAPPTSAGGQNGVLGSIAIGNSLPAPPPTPGPVTSERIFVEPRVLSTVLPIVYPKIAIQRGDEGEVMLTAMVNEAGKVTGTKVISGPLTLRQAAADWVRQWRMEPAKLNGKPVSAPVTVKVVFHKPR